MAAPGYLDGRSAPKTPDEIGGHECICYSRAGDGRSWTFSDGSDDIFVRIAPRLVANNAVAAYYECVEEGHEPFNDAVKEAMDGYAEVFGTTRMFGNVPINVTGAKSATGS